MLYSVTDEKMKQTIQTEWNLQGFYFQVHNFIENEQGFKLSDISPYVNKFKELCDDNTVTYYKKRFETTPSILNKSRYAFGCWFLTHEPKYLEEFIGLLLNSTQFSDRKASEKVHFLITAYNLSKIYNIDRYLNDIGTLTLSFFYNFLNKEPVGWVIRPITIFSKIYKSADFNLINNLISNLHREANRYFQEGNFSAQQFLLNTSLQLTHLTNLDNSLKEKLKAEIHTMIAESQEFDGNQRWKKNEAMGAVWCFENAIKEYQKAGKQDKINSLNENIRASQDIQWHETRMEFSMHSLKLDGNNGLELTNSICNIREKIPNLEQITQQAQEQMAENPISNMFSKTTFNTKNPVSHDDGGDSRLISEIRRLTVWTIQLAENRLSLTVKPLEKENKISSQDFIKFFEDMQIYDDNHLPILKSGIENHFKNDYIATIHTLIPQIEGTLRLVLEKKRVSVLKTKNDVIMDNELGGILNKPEIVQILGSDLAHYLKTKYTESAGLNQRNEVSHSLSSISIFNHATSLSIIQDLMIISSI